MAYDDGGMDGFLRASSNDEYTIGYYTQADLPFYARLLRTTWLARDRYFASILGPTFPNRLFQWAAQTDRLDDTVTFSSLPTILDRLSEAGVSHRYFFSSVPFLAMWGVKYIGSSEWFAEFLEPAAAGGLVCRRDLYGIG